MKTELIVVGRTVDKHLSALIDDYVERLTHYMPFKLTVIPELKATKTLSIEQQKQREGELIARHIESSDFVVLLDEQGVEYRSVELAQWLQKRMIQAKRLVLVVGGPYGFSPSVYQRANEKISLSRLTFSHQMVRLIVVEQLYRACTIIKGEPYHHE